MIDRLYADNFRCHVNFELRLSTSQLLLGGNGCGKSSLWEILAKIQEVIARGASVEDAFPSATRTRWDPRFTQRFELDATLDGDLYTYRLELEHAATIVRNRPSVAIKTEELKASGAWLYRRSPEGIVELFDDVPSASEPRTRVPFDERRSFLPSLQLRPEDRRLRIFRDYVERMQILSISLSRSRLSVSRRRLDSRGTAQTSAPGSCRDTPTTRRSSLVSERT